MFDNSLVTFLKLPIILLIGLINAIYYGFTSKSIIPEGELNDKKYQRIFGYISIFFYLGLGYLIYMGNVYRKEYHIYACNSLSGSKCYKLIGDYVPSYCDEGYCDPDYFEKIYFSNGGYITFEYCDKKGEKFICYPETDKNQGAWEIEISEIKKVKK